MKPDSSGFPIHANPRAPLHCRKCERRIFEIVSLGEKPLGEAERTAEPSSTARRRKDGGKETIDRFDLLASAKSSSARIARPSDSDLRKPFDPEDENPYALFRKKISFEKEPFRRRRPDSFIIASSGRENISGIRLRRAPKSSWRAHRSNISPAVNPFRGPRILDGLIVKSDGDSCAHRPSRRSPGAVLGRSSFLFSLATKDTLFGLPRGLFRFAPDHLISPVALLLIKAPPPPVRVRACAVKRLLERTSQERPKPSHR